MADKQKEMQQKYMEMQMLEQQMQQVQKQLQMIEQQTLELDTTKDAIDELGKTKVGSETLVPISSGIFVKAEIKDNKKLTVNVGSGVAVENTIDEAKGLVDEQIKEINDFKKELTLNLEKLAAKAQEIQEELSKLVK